MLLLILLFATIIFSVSAVAYKSKIANRLKTFHIDTYQRLLLSDSFDDNEFEKQTLFSDFIKSKGFYSLGDNQLSLLCNRYIFTGRLASFSGVALLLGVALVIYLYR